MKIECMLFIISGNPNEDFSFLNVSNPGNTESRLDRNTPALVLSEISLSKAEDLITSTYETFVNNGYNFKLNSNRLDGNNSFTFLLIASEAKGVISLEDLDYDDESFVLLGLPTKRKHFQEWKKFSQFCKENGFCEDREWVDVEDYKRKEYNTLNLKFITLVK